MREEIVKIIDEYRVRGIVVQVVETKYEFGRHYIMLTNGEPGFHSIDLERVRSYAKRCLFLE